MHMFLNYSFNWFIQIRVVQDLRSWVWGSKTAWLVCQCITGHHVHTFTFTHFRNSRNLGDFHTRHICCGPIVSDSIQSRCICIHLITWRTQTHMENTPWLTVFWVLFILVLLCAIKAFQLSLLGGFYSIFSCHSWYTFVVETKHVLIGLNTVGGCFIAV